MRELVYYDLGLIDYEKAWDLQRKTFDSRRNKDVPDTLYLLEHPHTYTLGKVADRKNLISSENFLKEKGISVYDIDRGGDITYHGPGQIVGYPILDLTEWKQDTHLYLRSIEEVIILTCRDYGLHAGRIEKLTGVWIEDRKIAAIGIKVSRWITMHGFAFNVTTDLSLFQGIIPCGITDKSVTSLSKELGYDPDMNEVKEKLVNNFKRIFNYDSVLSNQENQLLLRSTGLS
ncbi:MAG: lipoyl(octanoyl) transferase LipB [Ignavibacteria bacterium]|jgi:lipoyl(octanoyl) transferase|nr:lipoyl(octanoyl) transferase LipB [Ignavibacteria bacterium]MCU7512924.1 lipoyl(octanoyl) transferase LipB [Ignavibacteria bacterium]MCU7520181.1 lipoyl(octanoyl) transferase LipB [Ignavibacteria bacterium]